MPVVREHELEVDGRGLEGFRCEGAGDQSQLLVEQEGRDPGSLQGHEEATEHGGLMLRPEGAAYYNKRGDRVAIMKDYGCRLQPLSLSGGEVVDYFYVGVSPVTGRVVYHERGCPCHLHPTTGVGGAPC